MGSGPYVLKDQPQPGSKDGFPHPPYGIAPIPNLNQCLLILFKKKNWGEGKGQPPHSGPTFQAEFNELLWDFIALRLVEMLMN